jgi:hypothetical protein
MTARDGSKMPERTSDNHGRNGWPRQGEGDGPQQRAAISEVATDFGSSKKIDHIGTMGGIYL